MLLKSLAFLSVNRLQVAIFQLILSLFGKIPVFNMNGVQFEFLVTTLFREQFYNLYPESDFSPWLNR